MKKRQLIVLIILLFITTIFVFMQNDTMLIRKSIDLNEALHQVPSYTLLRDTVTENRIINTLRLDDVSQKRFVREDEVIDLYVGYYFSVDKLSAPHSPLVCIPGHGWVLEGLAETNHSFNGYKLNYAEVIANKGNTQTLHVYWFQAYDKSAPNMHINIYNALVNVITGKSPETAFIRISIPVKQGDRTKALKTALDFIQKFYPTFMDYVNDRQHIIGEKLH